MSKEKEQYIKTHLKEYSQRFIREEHEEKQKALKELQEKRDSILNEFGARMAEFKKAYEDSREARRELWGGVASDEDRFVFFFFFPLSSLFSFLFFSFLTIFINSGWEEYEETVEEVLSQQLEYF